MTKDATPLDADLSAPRRVLAALSRGALGDAYFEEIPDRIFQTFSSLASQADLARLIGILKLLDTRPGALTLTGRAVPVSWLTATEAERVLQRWKSSRTLTMRNLAAAVLSASLSALYSRPGPEWERLGYPGPLHAPSREPKTIEVLPIESDIELNCDVVIVGSGAGGGCAAGVLAQAGLDVIVLEKGAYRNEADFSQIESEGQRDMYLYGGTFTTADQGIRLFAGSTLGGGTVINWASSWRTPEVVLNEWAQVSGVEAFVNGEIERSLDSVCTRLNVNEDDSKPFARDVILEEALHKLDWHVGVFPRNTRGCSQDEACGFCTYGCRIGAKQSSLKTYLQDAADAGARIVTGVDVRKVLVVEGRAVGVEGTSGGHRLTVRATAVIAAAGSLETPALLLRSGLKGQIGRNLRLHPATACLGIFDEELRPWGGVMQARYSNHLLDEPAIGAYGPTLETGPLHPGSLLLLPWEGARQHHELAGAFARMSPVGFPLRERGSGRVKIDRKGVPRIEYKVSAEDERRMVEGIIACGKVLETAGAREIYSIHRTTCSYRPGSPGAHEAWADEVRRRGVNAGALSMFSMHQMGSCRMGMDPKTSAVGADNQSHEVDGLYVMDASTFPTPSGVNPMISIYGIAHRAATKLADRLS